MSHTVEWGPGLSPGSTPNLGMDYGAIRLTKRTLIWNDGSVYDYHLGPAGELIHGKARSGNFKATYDALAHAIKSGADAKIL